MNSNIKTVYENELYLQSPFRLTCSGPSGSGKSYFIEGFLDNLDRIINVPMTKIVFAYGQYQERFKEIAKKHKDIIWVEGFPHDEIDKIMADPKTHKLLICDDLIDQVAGDKRFIAWYIKKSHHMLVNIIFTVQNLFQPGLRTINLNTTAYCLFKSVRDQTQVRTLALQMYPGSKWKAMTDIYREATRFVISLLSSMCTMKHTQRSILSQ